MTEPPSRTPFFLASVFMAEGVFLGEAGGLVESSPHACGSFEHADWLEGWQEGHATWVIAQTNRRPNRMHRTRECWARH